MNLLEIKNLNISFDTPDGIVRAVSGVDFNLEKNDSLAIVGESGSGKTQLVFSILGLLAKNATSSGSIKYESKEILNASEKELNSIRSKKISIIFQDPMTSLNPYMRISDQLNEVLIHHKGISNNEAMKESIKMLDAVKIPEVKNRINMFPHEFSGGMRQRVMIAMSLLCRPDILIADEPTTSLDVTIQAAYLRLLKRIQSESDIGIIFITHDFGIVAKMCDRVAVMYLGHIIELAETDQLFVNALKTERSSKRNLL